MWVVSGLAPEPRRKAQFQCLSTVPQTRIRALVHSSGSFRKRRGERRNAAEAKAQLASLEVPPRSSALGLARINRVTGTTTAAIARQPSNELGHALLAMGAMQPWPGTAEAALGPRDPDLLIDSLIAQFQMEKISGNAHLLNAGPQQCWAKHNPSVSQDSSPLKVTHT